MRETATKKRIRYEAENNWREQQQECNIGPMVLSVEDSPSKEVLRFITQMTSLLKQSEERSKEHEKTLKERDAQVGKVQTENRALCQRITELEQQVALAIGERDHLMDNDLMQLDARGLAARYNLDQIRSLVITFTKAIPIKLDEQEVEHKCAICMGKPKNVAFIPCGHVCCCQQCSESSVQCPVCRSNITQRTTIFI